MTLEEEATLLGITLTVQKQLADVSDFDSLSELLAFLKKEGVDEKDVLIRDEYYGDYKNTCLSIKINKTTQQLELDILNKKRKAKEHENYIIKEYEKLKGTKNE